MLFPSEVFLFVFLPVVLVVYYGFLVRTRNMKNIFLLAASLFFYAWGEPVYVYLMIATICLNWFYGILADRFKGRKTAAGIVLFLMVLTNIGILGWFKYSGFAVANVNRFLHVDWNVPVIDLPIGISFFTFQAMSYVIDVYKGRGKVQKNLLNVGLFISLFPQLIAGPIVRYETVAEQIEHRKENMADFSAGVTRFCIGLGKKVLIANNMAVVADAAFGLIVEKRFCSTAMMAWLGAISYTLQIFFDFSGYSDMAIGLGKMFGFRFEENFRYPYIARSISEFWRRWHISLQTWFKDYVYIPLGGSRVSKGRQIFNIFAVWALTGIWHGAAWTFIAWGLMYFVLITFEKITGLDKKSHWAGHIYTMLFVILGWVLFRSANIGEAVAYMKAMFGIGARGFADGMVLAYLRQKWIYYLAAVIGCAPVFGKLDRKITGSRPAGIAYVVGILAVFIISVSFVCNNAYNPFIYFNF